VANLRVVDASILPTVPAANTQLSVIAVAEMLARVPA
jgi:choline dehydrogenase